MKKNFVSFEINEKGKVVPSYYLGKVKDAMFRGKDIIAYCNPADGKWCTDKNQIKELIDEQGRAYTESKGLEEYKYLPVTKSLSKQASQYSAACHAMADDFIDLDRKITFKSDKVKLEDYVSNQLDYDLEEGEPECYNKVMSVLYSDEDRQKLEWAIGAIFKGDSKRIQKFIVLYGAPGTGKSTVIDLIKMLFKGYTAAFEASKLGDRNSQFATAAFKNNPLVAYQDDGDLSRIEDNSILNSITSHKTILINEKGVPAFEIVPDAFCFMATNTPVKITDMDSGMYRRLMMIAPTGNKIEDEDEFYYLEGQFVNERGKIANRCIKVYESLGKKYYSKDRATDFMYKTNVIYNFANECYEQLSSTYIVKHDVAYRAYKQWCEDSGIAFVANKLKFVDEMSHFYEKSIVNSRIKDLDTDEVVHVRNAFVGFKTDMFVKVLSSDVPEEKSTESFVPDWLQLAEGNISEFDKECCDCPAQYGNDDELPMYKWDNVTTTLKEIFVNRLHYVRVPENHIVIDFDLKDGDEKSLKKNIKACIEAGFPPTYAETSKSGNGLHLHYIYDGDPEQLSALFEPEIEQKVFKGKSAVRRKLVMCNTLAIAHIGDGLLKKRAKEKKMYNGETFKNDKDLINRITKCINKEYENVPSTASNISLIKKILDDAYASGKTYDVTVMRPSVTFFAAQSTNQSNKCLTMVSEMHFKSDGISEQIEEVEEGKDYGAVKWDDNESKIAFFDLEVYPNKLILCYKSNRRISKSNPHNDCYRVANPSPEEVDKFVKKYLLVGFNNRMYDNHILYGRMMGYDNQQLYELSQRLISHDKKSDDKNCYFKEAYNLSFADVYDFASAANKQSLKKWEVELGIDHIEMDIPWDEPLPDNMVDKVCYYCENDVLATQAVFEHLKADWEARKSLARITGSTPMATTNTLTTKLIFGNNRKPQGEFVYTDLSTIFPGYEFEQTGVGRGKSSYRGEDPSEGGYVYAEPGMYTDVALLDVQSMHPASIVALNLFGDRYTKRFKELRDARVAIKHRDTEALKTLFDGAFAEYAEADDETLTNLSTALKTAINSVYGLTSALFDNPFRDPRNVDNIVAKRGALFMMTLRDEVQKRGFTVVHIKTDSIKIANATPEIIDFCMDFGKQYGYIFEHEATFSKLCLVNKAVLIGKIAGGKHDGEWEAVGAQFQHSFVYKTLFSHEPLTFKDFIETKSVKTSLYIDDTYLLPEGEHHYCFVGKTGGFIAVRPEMLPTTTHSQTSLGCGDLVASREGKDGETKYVSVTGTKGYKWYPSQFAESILKDSDGNIKTDMIDMTYYQHLIDDAVDQLNKYGDANWFME